MRLPNLRFDCDKCGKPIIVTWRPDHPTGGEIPFVLQCQHCGWAGTKLIQDGHPT
jgi:ribosomal protein L44E